MLSRVSSPRSTSLSLHLLRHFSIRVSPLKKGSLAARLLRRDASPTLRKFTQEGGLLLDPHSSSGGKAIDRLSQPHGHLRLSDKQAPFGASVKLPVLENGRQEDHGLVQEDACCHGIVKPSVRSQRKSKEAPNRGGAVNLLVTDDNKTHCRDGDVQPSVQSQAGQSSYGGAKLSQIKSRKVRRSQAPTDDHSHGPAVSKLQVPTNDHSHGPAESKASRRDGKRSGEQNRRASCKPCLPSSKSMDPSEGISSLIASERGDGPEKPVRGNVLHTEREEGNEEQGTVISSTSSLKISAPSLTTEKRKQVKARERHSTEFVEVHSVVIKKKGTDNFLPDLHQKIELVRAESAPLTLVQALLKKTAFLSASPEKLAGVIHVLKEFFEASDMVCDVLKENTGIIAHPLEQLTQKLQVLAEFQVDVETCHKIGASPYMMIMKVEKYQSVLAFLKDLGLSVESRNKMLRRSPMILRRSQDSLQSTVHFFASIGITGPKLLKLLELRPRILLASVNNNLMVKHKLFQQLGFSAKEFVVALERISQNSNEQILLQYNLFREQGISHEDVTKMIRRQPRVLGQSVESLKAKLDFLLLTVNRDISEAVKFPAYLTYSLKDRIIPRFKVLEELNLSKSPSLPLILSRKSSVFRDRFKIPDSMQVT